ncbi:hypothetical protein [Hymenobacter wooponensis]|uniref:Lipoprotein n=1 Tax=Hymenobacter wooponensis TaxID=1525360 RepID=A0A4Z0MSU5_9BACT|nr:hypothetical protein [Hymenobacter wooponensis]TGD82882.1 hypothetical protein EU557_03620 [Hymenobacter wooponensis]
MKHYLLLSVMLSVTACALPKGTAAPGQEPVDVALSQLDYQRDQPHKAANYLESNISNPSSDLGKEHSSNIAAKPASLAPIKEKGFLKSAVSKVASVFASSGKFKNKGTIIIQEGTGNTAAVPSKTEAPVQLGQQNKATDNREAGADGGAAGIGKGNTPSVSVKEVGPPWYVYAVLVLASATGGWILRNHASKWAWVPARWKLA